MGTYIISLLSASLAVAIIGILAPDGGVSKHLRLFSSLFLICVLTVPVTNAIKHIQSLTNGDFDLSDFEESVESDLLEQMQSGMDESSKAFFLDSLSQMLASEFAISEGDVRCVAKWGEQDGNLYPQRMTVVLSGSGIWKDTAKIEQFVSDLLGCECITAIE